MLFYPTPRMYLFSKAVIPDDPDACWSWSGPLIRGGYGEVRISTPVGTRPRISAHVLSFWLAGGVLTKERPFVLHSCDNPPCTNPRHLRAGSTKDNTADMLARGRGNFQKRTSCLNGHPYPENAFYKKTGGKRCRICNAIYAKRKEERRQRQRELGIKVV